MDNDALKLGHEHFKYEIQTVTAGPKWMFSFFSELKLDVTNWAISWLIRVEMRHVLSSTFFLLRYEKECLGLDLLEKAEI